MAKKLLLATTIALSSAMMSFASLADNPSSSTDSNEMSKDTWLSTMTPMLPDLICKGFMQDANLKKRFDDLKITYEQCVSYIPESATKCQNQIYGSIPDKINNDSAATWGKTLGECIGKDFAEKHLIPKP
jgi:hypothetical protein